MLLKSLITKIRVRRHKRKLAGLSESFQGYPETAFVFQSFNKSSNVPAILKPVLEKKLKNIIFFADGCIDRSAHRAHRLLSGRQHYVVQSNDTHEISNYRLAAQMARAMGCRQAVLLQDDDIYSSDLFDWVDRASAIMNQDNSIVIVGGNGGVNFVPAGCRMADDGLTTARFEMWRDGRRRGFRLGKYQEMTFSPARPSEDLSSLSFVAVVNRAPQMVAIEASLQLGFFPVELEPFQYDDHYNCLQAWVSGHKVLHLPTPSRRGNIGEGGMRLYNDVGLASRPPHFFRNWNLFWERFGPLICDGQIERSIERANRELHRLLASR